MKNFLLLFVLFFGLKSSAQSVVLKSDDIPENLKENADAVIRFAQKDILISSKESMTIVKKKTITILNESGLKSLDASEYFDKSTKVKSIEAIVYNAFGQEIKKFKRKDFMESAVSDGSTITDGKVLFLDYTPTNYPFTVVYLSELQTSNTAFVPSWYPISDSFLSVEKSIINISYPSDLGFKYKEFRLLNNENIKKVQTDNSISFTAENLSAIKTEEYSPSFKNLAPYVMFGLSSFNLEGVFGKATDWNSFGLWMYENLLKGTDEISPETQLKIKALVGNEKDKVKIAKIIYNYVQNKTRYISIQLGIGGWKPMLAKDVDRLGYGDCKALSNYTRALLNIVGVTSYYTVIYSGSSRQDLQQDFVSMQGDHVILAVPVDEKIYWLECTSQKTPFNYQGNFTNDRMALLVKPEGGQIVRTSENTNKINTQISKGKYLISEEGALSGSVSIKSKGTQYENKYIYETSSSDDLKSFYKRYFSNINNLNLKKIDLSNNKEDIEFSENIILEAPKYASLSGTKIMFPLNAFNQSSAIPKRYRVRNNPLEISSGFYDYDEITIDLPAGYKIEAKPDDFEFKGVFGYYKTEYIVVNENQLLYKRHFETTSGFYDKNEYDNFRKFKEQIAKNDNAKIVIVKN